MRLLFCIKALSTLGGGAERVFVDVVNGLHDRGEDVTVLTFESATAETFYEVNKHIPRLALGEFTTKAAQVLALRTLRRKILDHAPDVVVGFMPSCYVPLSAALAFSGIPLIASEHNVPARYQKQPAHWLAILAASRFVDRITAVSEQMRREYPAAIQHKMRVLPNPVSVAVGANADTEGRFTASKRILAVGRLHEQKDHLTLIRAFAMIRTQFPDWSVRILGDGTERGKLEQEIARFGLERQIVMAGTTRDIGAEYAAAQLFVIPSRYESLGLATIEALAHGLPAVGFADCPGTNEIIQDDVNGRLVDPGEDRVSRLAAALGALLSDTQMRVRLAIGARTGSRSHSFPAVLDRWLQLMDEVKSRPQCGSR